MGAESKIIRKGRDYKEQIIFKMKLTVLLIFAFYLSVVRSCNPMASLDCVGNLQSNSAGSDIAALCKMSQDLIHCFDGCESVPSLAGPLQEMKDAYDQMKPFCSNVESSEVDYLIGDNDSSSEEVDNSGSGSGYYDKYDGDNYEYDYRYYVDEDDYLYLDW